MVTAFWLGTFFCTGQELQPIESKEIKSEALFSEGEKYFILEDYGKAVEFFRRSGDVKPSAAVHFKIAESLSKSERREDLELAMTEIEKALKMDPNNKFFYELAAQIGGATGRFSRAAEILEASVKKFPSNSSHLFELASMYQFQNEPEKAIDALSRAERILGVNETSSIRKMDLLGDLGKFKQAEEEGRKLISAFPEETRYLTGLASLLIQQEKNTEARTLLESVPETEDEGGYARLLLIDLLLKSGETNKVIDLAFGLMADPLTDWNNKIIVIKAIQSALDLKDMVASQKLIRLTDELKKNEPDIPEVWLTSADLLMAMGDRKSATYEYRVAIRKGATAFQAWSNLLILESQENLTDSLIIHSESAMEYFPNQPELWYFNGFGHFKKKNFKVACNSFEQARKLSSNPAFTRDILLLLGDAYHAAGDHVRSDQAFEEVLRGDPDQDLALNNYSYYLALRKEKLDRATELSQRLIKKFSNNNSYLDTYSWVLFAKGDFKEARKIMEVIVKSGGANATHLEHYGDILFKLGETDEALKQWEMALSMNSRNEALRKKILNRKLN